MMFVKIYGTSTCRFCIKAKELVEDLGIPFQYVNISQDEKARRFVLDELKETKIPQCFINNDHIGGYTELREALKNQGEG